MMKSYADLPIGLLGFTDASTIGIVLTSVFNSDVTIE